MLELAGWECVELDGLPFWQHPTDNHVPCFEEDLDKVFEYQLNAEQVADALIDRWYLDREKNPPEGEMEFYAGIGPPEGGDDSGFGFGSTRAEAIAAMLYAWLEERD